MAEDHDSNPIKIGLGKLKKRGKKIISVNPVQTGYAAVSDDWYGVTPGTDGLLIISLIRELMLSGNIDLDYLRRYTNSPWLVIQNPGTKDHGLFLRNEKDEPLVIDRKTGKTVPHNRKNVSAAMHGEIPLKTGGTAVPVFVLLYDEYTDDKYKPEFISYCWFVSQSNKAFC